MNAEDRKVLEEIREEVQHVNKVTSALSISLIGRSNGDVVDEKGGRLGRLEGFVWWLFCGILAALGSIGYMIIDRIVKGFK